MVLFDSFTKGQGGVYITGKKAHECSDDELTEALRVHNMVRTRYDSNPIEGSFYQNQKPAQRMYSIDVAKIEIYTVFRDENGQIAHETRSEVAANVLLGD